MRSPSWRQQRTPGYLLLAILSLVAAAACGSAASTGSAAPGSPASRSAAPAAKVALTVVVKASPGAKPQRWTLTCDPVGGTHPHAKAACRELLGAKNPFAPIPRGIMCPMIPAGPQSGSATVTGTFFGQQVSGTFSRQSPCAASRWAELGVVFGSAQSVTGVSGSPVH
ncbi:MAG TPA: SSI family serine proteinase inhibitor [Streptosporangiaceae bacterium]|nr:SSI family serine proteinase inhibitor [Streptosporangiaceae bacterium]